MHTSSQLANRRIGFHFDPGMAKDACQAIDTGATLLNMANIDDSIAALSQQLDKWRIQGKTEELCWVDSDGNKIEHPELAFSSDENNTLVLDTVAHEMVEAKDNASLGYICQMENNGGKTCLCFLGLS